MTKPFKSKLDCVNEAGVVLFTTMVLMTLILSLVLSLLQGILLLWKAHNHLVSRHHTLYRLEAVTQQFPKLLKPECLSDNEDVEPLLRESNQCLVHIDKQEFHYKITELGLYPCLQVHYKNKLVGSEHWLLTVLAREEKSYLQIRIAMPADTLPCMQSTARILDKKFLSWRYSYIETNYQ